MSGALIGTGVSVLGAAYGASQAAKAAKAGSKETSGSPWLDSASQNALQRADAVSQRPYQAFGGEQVAGLSQNELQAQRMASAFGNQQRQQMQGGFQASNLDQFKNPYIDQVLGNQRRVLGQEYGRQSASLAAGQSAMDAFRSGRSDLARSRLDQNRATALGDAEAVGQAGAFDSAMKNYFQNQQQQQSAFTTAQDALNRTGANERGVRQAQDTADYSNFLEKRDWDVNNLQPLFAGLTAAKGGAMNTTTSTGPAKDYWGAAAGLLGTAISTYANKTPPATPPPDTGGYQNLQNTGGMGTGTP